MDEKKAVIVDIVRTPWGREFSSMDKLDAGDLASAVLMALTNRAGFAPEEVGQVIFGQGHPTTYPGNIGHFAWLKAKLPVCVPGYTVQGITASALQAARNAYYLVATGNEDTCIAGGVDSYSAAPFVMRDVRNHFDKKNRVVLDTLEETECCTQPEHISRAELYFKTHPTEVSENAKTYRAESRKNAEAYVERNLTRIIPVSYTVRKKGEITVAEDELLRMATEEEGPLAEHADGAAAMMVMSEEAAIAHGLNPLAVMEGFAVAAETYEKPQDAAVAAVHKLLARKNLTIKDVACIEILENSADEVAEIKEKLGVSGACNPCGGALAFGLNDGAEGMFMLMRLIAALKPGEYGVGCIYSAGGLGMAVMIRRS